MTQALLAVDNLEVVYQRAITAVQGISLSLAPRQIVGIIGTNGAGKSTLLRAISGFHGTDDARVTEGTIRFKGQRIESREPHRLARLGMALVPERDKVFPNLTVAENLAVPVAPRAGRNELRQREEQVLQLFPQLSPLRRRLAGLLSGGERQMLALASALVCKPDLLLVDELSLGLAPVVVQDLAQRLLQIRTELGISHRARRAERGGGARRRRLRLRDGERPHRARWRQPAPLRPSRRAGVLSGPIERRQAAQLPRRQAIPPQPEMVWLRSTSTA